jgi:hypothetical protein
MSKGRDNKLRMERDSALLERFQKLVNEGQSFKDIFVVLRNEFYLTEDTIFRILKREHISE